MKTIFSRTTELKQLRDIADIYLNENKKIKNLKTPSWIDNYCELNIEKLKIIKSKIKYFKGDKELSLIHI